MTTVALTKEAFASLYSAPDTVLVGAASWARLSAEVPADIRVLCLHGNGVISEDEKTPKSKSQLLAPIGLPTGLFVLVISPAEAAAAAAVVEYANSQNMHRVPDIVVVSRWSYRAVHQFRKYLGSFLATSLQEKSNQLTFREKALAHLRRENETLRLGVEKMRRLLASVGYDTRSIAVDIPRGENTVGPSGDEEAQCFRQQLPCDVIGLAGISLYFSAASSDDGHVLMRVVRAIDEQPLVVMAAPYRSLSHGGWYTFYFDHVITGAFGAANLEITWQGSDNGDAPNAFLSNFEADRFGDERGKTLAMQVLRGVADPMNEGGKAILSPHVPYRCQIADMADAVELVFNDQKELNSGGPVAVDLSDGWLQTHLVANGISGVKLSMVVPTGSKTVEVSTCTANQLAPVVCYFLAMVPSGDQRDLPGMLSNLARQAAMGSKPGQTMSGDMDGIQWVASVNAALEKKPLRLDLAAETVQKSDLFLIAVSPSMKDDYGWCRWQDLRFGLAPKVCEPTAVIPFECQPVPDRRMSVMRFADLARRANFIGRDCTLEELTERLGFSPYMLNDDDGSMQTHPLLDQVSAVSVPNIIPQSSVCVRSQIETAHAGAPEFLYLMVVIDDKAVDPGEILDSLRSSLDPNNPDTLDGADAARGIYWTARGVRPGNRHSIEINFEAELGNRADAIFAVLPISDSIAFGWCRWYSLSVITEIIPPPVAGRG